MLIHSTRHHTMIDETVGLTHLRLIIIDVWNIAWERSRLLVHIVLVYWPSLNILLLVNRVESLHTVWPHTRSKFLNLTHLILLLLPLLGWMGRWKVGGRLFRCGLFTCLWGSRRLSFILISTGDRSTRISKTVGGWAVPLPEIYRLSLWGSNAIWMLDRSLHILRNLPGHRKRGFLIVHGIRSFKFHRFCMCTEIHIFTNFMRDWMLLILLLTLLFFGLSGTFRVRMTQFTSYSFFTRFFPRLALGRQLIICLNCATIWQKYGNLLFWTKFFINLVFE